MNEILKSLEEKINTISNMNELNDLRVEYLGKKVVLVFYQLRWGNFL